MERMLRIGLFLIGAFPLTIFSVGAYDFEYEGIYYKIISKTEATSSVDRGTNEYTGEIVIPQEVQGGDGNFVVGPGGEIIGPPVVDYSKNYRVTAIEENAFGGCLGLKSVTLPSSVASIKEQAFQNCWSLVKITCLGQIPPVCETNSFENVDKGNCVVYVPQGRLAAYRSAPVWKDFPTIIESNPSEVTDTQNGVKIFGKDGQIVIVGMAEGDQISVYNVNGVLIAVLPVTGDNMAIRLRAGGIYLVKYSGGTIKVKL